MSSLRRVIIRLLVLEVCKLETTQGNLLKQSLGFSKRSRTSHLLHALNVDKIEAVLKYNIASLLTRIMSVPSPAQNLCSYFMAMFASKDILIPGTLVSRVVKSSLSPMNCVFNPSPREVVKSKCGIVDSLKNLIMTENFIEPYCEEHILATLLVRAF